MNWRHPNRGLLHRTGVAFRSFALRTFHPIISISFYFSPQTPNRIIPFPLKDSEKYLRGRARLFMERYSVSALQPPGQKSWLTYQKINNELTTSGKINKPFVCPARALLKFHPCSEHGLSWIINWPKFTKHFSSGLSYSTFGNRNPIKVHKRHYI